MGDHRVLALDLGLGEDAASSLGTALQQCAGFCCSLRRAEPGGLPAETLEPLQLTQAEGGGGVVEILVLCLAAGGVGAARTFFELIRHRLWETPVILAAAGLKPDLLAELLRLGAADFVLPPFRPEELVARFNRWLPSAPVPDLVSTQLFAKLGEDQFIGRSPALLQETAKIPLLAACEASVLIAGETGTGKELYARAIHYLSRRSAKPFIAVNSGAIPVDLLENELFGHEPGAFTSATTSSQGLIREAEGGTLFLDEVDALPPGAQVKLLRFLQEKELRPLGGRKAIKADVRVLCATNTDLDEARRAGRFRHDLYFRLNVISVRLPPLRERLGDLEMLAAHFLTSYAREYGKPYRGLTPGALNKLLAYDWPGNIRELENVLAGAVVLSQGPSITRDDLALAAPPRPCRQGSFNDLKARLITQFEQGYVQEMLKAHGGNISRAAIAAGKDRRAFWELMRKHRIAVRTPADRSARTLPSG
jgi:two-component system response regulator GlrR